MKITLKLIHEQIKNHFEVDNNFINQNTRKLEVRLVRQLAHYLAKKYTKKTLDSIAFYFGRKNHCTVLNSVKKIQNLIDTNDELIIDDFNKLDKRLEYLRDYNNIKAENKKLKLHTRKIVKDQVDNIKIFLV